MANQPKAWLLISQTPYSSDRLFCDLVLEADGRAPVAAIYGIISARDAEALAEAFHRRNVAVTVGRSRSDLPFPNPDPSP
jgi:hypothetical protein